MNWHDFEIVPSPIKNTRRYPIEYILYLAVHPASIFRPSPCSGILLSPGKRPNEIYTYKNGRSLRIRSGALFPGRRLDACHPENGCKHNNISIPYRVLLFIPPHSKDRLTQNSFHIRRRMCHRDISCAVCLCAGRPPAPSV